MYEALRAGPATRNARSFFPSPDLFSLHRAARVPALTTSSNAGASVFGYRNWPPAPGTCDVGSRWVLMRGGDAPFVCLFILCFYFYATPTHPSSITPFHISRPHPPRPTHLRLRLRRGALLYFTQLRRPLPSKVAGVRRGAVTRVPPKPPRACACGMYPPRTRTCPLSCPRAHRAHRTTRAASPGSVPSAAAREALWYHPVPPPATSAITV
ncbi:hypothetical protein HYPSUDRAFT_791182 [Hypholoma sublateritium FD-334 SS-4]|uniref:Uncharacterized protein n=1 Tax=Hypholoma sublateritium (strain FD-334 SS-4) TaxID=945553 RepID=A0A0D2LJT3_HYPSF|nr:hypothetical protein HYPSUDRAFT_791182 [Hypholoma sublateritium FD-334 SS-4]